MWESRVLRRAFERLELHEGKLSRAVLRGGGGGDVTSLPDAGVGNHPGLPGLKLYERVMAGRRRKTLVLCRKWHADVHAGRRDGATTEEGSDWKAG